LHGHDGMQGTVATIVGDIRFLPRFGEPFLEFPQDETAMETLARYIIRASFSQERMQYFPGPSKVVYQAKEGSEEKVFDALEWLAAMCSHIPDRGEQMVRYYGYYSNVCRGKRSETEAAGVPCIS